MIPSPVKTQLRAIFERDHDADCVAVVWPEETVNTDRVTISGHDVKLVYCISELAMREALVNHDKQTRLVMLSRFDEVHLAKDVIARIWKNEPQRISPWKTLQQLIKVREIDPRLSKKSGRWMAEALLNCYDKYSNSVSFGEVLDLDNAWKALAVGYLNYSEKTFDLDAWFRWSISEDVTALIDQLPKDVKENISDWFELGAPKTAKAIDQIIRAGHGNDLLAVSLACSTMYQSGISQSGLVEASNLYSSQGRFVERFLSGENLSVKILQALGRDAYRTIHKLVQEQGIALLDKVGSRTEQILASLDLMPLCAVSTLLPHGYQLRIEAFAKVLEKSINGKFIEPAENALLEVKQHILASFPKSQEQIHNSQMALRLVRWLNNHNSECNTVDSCLREYILHGGFVDWARSSIWSGDINESLTRVFLKISDAVTITRQAQNFAFSKHLPALARGDSLPANYLPVESTLERLLAPVASKTPVLLLVLDGMSQAVYRELSEDILKHNWVELAQEGVNQDTCSVTAFPTVTQVSRCSLLSGALSIGDSGSEKNAFKSNPVLKQIASTKFPPELFHKKDIQQSGSGALDSNIREKLAGTKYRILGVVINAIDDQLSSSSQVSVDWKLDSVTLLGHVLEAAKEAGRVIVITSDHGHVLDHDSFYQQSLNEGGERYQQTSSSLSDTEVEVSGDRVITGSKSVVMPWSEQLRYTKSKSMGYHGGASLQEVVIPLGVFANPSDVPVLDGWTETLKYSPDWWDADELSIQKVEITTQVPQIKNVKKAAVAEKMEDMFGEPVAADENIKIIDSDLAFSLVNSIVYKQQLQTAGRTNIKDDQVKTFVSMMVQSQGQAMESVVSKELNIPRIRIRGFLAGLQKTLNVDGYPIVSVNRDAQTIKLNIQDLKKQFEL
jgi:hypothetical protein